MNSEELRARTKQFALRIIKVAAVLPQTPTGRVIENQIVKSGTSELTAIFACAFKTAKQNSE